MNINKQKTVWIAAGGTGGHISPGVAVAQELMKRGVNVRFLTLHKNIGYPDFKREGIVVFTYDAPSLNFSFFKLIFFPFQFVRAFMRAGRLFKKEGADSLIAMGGYPVLPAALAATFCGVDVYLCEQNAVPGRANHLLARFAKKIFLTFDIEAAHKRSSKFAGRFRSKFELTGNPLRHAIQTTLPSAIKDQPNTSSLTVLILGGSQGARQINNMVLLSLANFPDERWLFQCGESQIDSVRSRLDSEMLKRIELFGFYANVHELYRQADIVICRAGAGILTEASAFALPMILIPYPFAQDAHQLANANYYVRGGAAVVIDQKTDDPEPLIHILRALKTDPAKLYEMRQASFALSKVKASSIIADRILSSDKES